MHEYFQQYELRCSVLSNPGNWKTVIEFTSEKRLFSALKELDIRKAR